MHLLFGIPYGPAVVSVAGSDGSFSSGTVLAAPTVGTGAGGTGGGSTGGGGTATATPNPHGYYSVIYSYDKSISSSTDGAAGIGTATTYPDYSYGDTVETANVHFDNYQSGAASAHFRGTFTANFTWHTDVDHPNSPAPAQVTVIKRSIASWGTSFYSNFSGNCDTGLGQYHGAGATTGSYDSVTGYASEVKGGATFSVSCTPTVDVYGTGGGGGASAQATATFTAAAVFMNLANTKPDSSKLDNILIGQHCTGSFSYLPSGLAGFLKYAWTVSGTKFDYWRPTTYATFDKPGNANASSFSDSPALTLSTAQWYWNDLKDKTTETVTGTATLTPPNGQGSVITISSKQSVIVRRPASTAIGVGGYMNVTLDGGHYRLKASPNDSAKSYGFSSGMNFQATLTAPTDSAFGPGSLVLAQLVTPDNSYTTTTNPNVVIHDPKMGIKCLDGSFPYGATGQEVADPALSYQDNDTPSVVLDASPLLHSANKSASYTDFLMYKPAGYDSSWVVLSTFGWSANGSATIPSPSQPGANPAPNDWSRYASEHGGKDNAGTVNPTFVSLDTLSKFTPITVPNTFPSWSDVDLGWNFGG